MTKRFVVACGVRLTCAYFVLQTGKESSKGRKGKNSKDTDEDTSDEENKSYSGNKSPVVISSDSDSGDFSKFNRKKDRGK